MLRSGATGSLSVSAIDQLASVAPMTLIQSIAPALVGKPPVAPSLSTET